LERALLAGGQTSKRKGKNKPLPLTAARKMYQKN